MTAKAKSAEYAAFLRGINVGGRSILKMTDLKAACERLGFSEVRTVLASGNVVFAAAGAPAVLAGRLEEALAKLCGREVRAILRPRAELERLLASAPFRGLRVTPTLRQYVSFLAAPVKPRGIRVPYAAPKGDLRILRVSPTEVISTVDLAAGLGTSELMALLEKEFGSDLTTRNWNTLEKLWPQASGARRHPQPGEIA